MRFGINTLDDYAVSGKTVLLRVDINQPVNADGTLKDTTRIKAAIKTMEELSAKGAKLVILAHQGSDIEYKNYCPLNAHAKVISQFLGREIGFIDDVCGPAAREAIQKLAAGDILLLDNVRHLAEEQTLFELKLCLSHEQQAKTLLVRTLAPLADLYICDAFAASHRDQPSLCAFEQLLPSAMGRLFEEEFCVVSSLMEKPARECVFLLGGAKISDAFLMMKTVLENGSADRILSGGLVGHILAFAKGIDLGTPSFDVILKANYGEFIETARSILAKFGERILIPVDYAAEIDGERREFTLEKLPCPVSSCDIGTETTRLYEQIIMNAGTVFVNGPVGIFESPAAEYGTKTLWNVLARTKAFTVAGGGDSITALNKYGLADSLSYVCTGGGALVRFLSGEELPVVKALRHAAKTFSPLHQKA